MAETPYTQTRKPRSIKKHKPDAFSNPASNWFQLTFIFGAISGILVYFINIYSDLYTQICLAVLSVIVGLIWFAVCGLSPRRADKSMIKFWFIVSEKRGKHVMNRLTVKKDTLKKVYPLKKIHKGGLIEFTGKEYGVLIKLNPKRINDDQREDHKAKVVGMVDGLFDGRHFKIVACSKVNPRKEIVEHLMQLANKIGSKERAEHLNGILLKIMGDKSEVMMYRYYGFLGIGIHNNLESANIAKNAVIEGLLLNMKRASLQPQPMENVRQIKNAYKEMSSERVIL